LLTFNFYARGRTIAAIFAASAGYRAAAACTLCTASATCYFIVGRSFQQ